MALDEPKDEDEIYDIDGFRYVVNKDFLEKVKPIKVDFSPIGFNIECGYDFGDNCAGCSCG